MRSCYAGKASTGIYTGCSSSRKQWVEKDERILRAGGANRSGVRRPPDEEAAPVPAALSLDIRTLHIGAAHGHGG